MSAGPGEEDHASPASLTFAALGVVFGDIGTSPLYALRACFSQAAAVPINLLAILGVLSLIFWSLALIICAKYVSIVLRADNHGEGGVLSLTTLVLSEAPRRNALLLSLLGLGGCALFFGDGVITPAISVMSAIEGLELLAPHLEAAVVPLAALTLLALFSLQKRGTTFIGRAFGPVMILWFAVLAALGAVSIAAKPTVLLAVNPYYAVRFLADHSGVALAVVAAVFLCVTGGEALYTDLGHFGRRPISRAWFLIVWPALLLNYFGQGALLLRDASALRNPFYLLAPNAWLLPLVLLATAATIIASQAVISGVFSITRQCQQLGYLPRWRVEHSSAQAIGQVYVPLVNWWLCAVTLGLVFAFGSSGGMAGAYGVGVSTTMLIDSILMLVLLSARSGATVRLQFGVMMALGVVEFGFVTANLGKIAEGGWFPVLYGLLVFGVMRTWQKGRAIVSARLSREERSVETFLRDLAQAPSARVDRTAVFLTSNPTDIPRTLVRNFRNNGMLHERTVLMTVSTEPVPRVIRGARVQVSTIAPGLYRVHAHVGFMETTDVPRLLRDAERAGLGFRTDDAIYYLGRDDIVVGGPRGMSPWRKRLFVFLANNAQFAGAHFGVPPARIMEAGGQVEI
ncbi:MAG: KUP/HAK/KT family potassium transporter [Steroidobacteraceae bacterium]